MYYVIKVRKKSGCVDEYENIKKENAFEVMNDFRSAGKTIYIFYSDYPDGLAGIVYNTDDIYSVECVTQDEEEST